MAGNALLNFTRTTTGYAATQMALSRMAAGTGVGAHDFLGSTSADADAELARTFNYAHDKFVSDHPIWFRILRSLTMTAGNRTVALPSDLRDLDIFSLDYINDPVTGQLGTQPLRMVSPEEMHRRGWEWVNEQNTANWPEFYCLQTADNDTGGFIEFYPMPNTTRTLSLTMRVADSDFTAVQLNDPASTKYVLIPDKVVPVFAWFLAADFAAMNWGPGSDQEMRLRARAQSENRWWIDKFSDGAPAQSVQARLEAAGQATGPGNDVAPSFTRFGRRGRWSGYGVY